MNATYVVEDRTAPSLVLGVLWFIFVGFLLGGIVTAVARALNPTIIGLPIAFWMFDRLPAVTTLFRYS